MFQVNTGDYCIITDAANHQSDTVFNDFKSRSLLKNWIFFDVYSSYSRICSFFGILYEL